MIKHVYSLALLAALSLPALAQDYKELPDPRRVDPVAWNAVKPGTHVYFGSADIRYDKLYAPEAASLRRSWEGHAWKGERVHTQFVVFTTTPLQNVSIETGALRDAQGHTIPATAVKPGFLRYVMTDELNAEGGGCGHRKPQDFDSSLVADAIDNISTINIGARQTQPVWLSVRVPANTAPGVYKGQVRVKANGRYLPDVLPYQVTVSSRTLPAPKDWAFHLDLWQSPYAVARVHQTPVWSQQHLDAMRPYMQMLADAGQKVVTASIIYDPWNSQTEDIYGDMVKWTKKKDGSWHYDYSVFDKWVSFMESVGIDKQIACYSMIPWNLKFYYHDEVARRDTFIVAKPGTAEYDAHWRPMLADFAKHLQAKGWFDKTCIAMDERPMEAMQHAIKLIRSVNKDFKVSLAGLYHKELVNDIYDYCVAAGSDFTKEEHRERAEKGWPSTFYTCCTEGFPNTFTFSPPAEAAWMGWHAANRNYSGYLRWAYNCWVKNPLQDSRFRTWAAGDTYLVYPGARTSIRFERLIEGIQAYEKVRILRAEGKAGPLEGILKKFEINALKAKPAGEMVTTVSEALNKL
ncbi:glycoside hydrolase domain-containing protein [Chitinophaga lutea]